MRKSQLKLINHYLMKNSSAVIVLSLFCTFYRSSIGFISCLSVFEMNMFQDLSQVRVRKTDESRELK